MAFYYLAEEIDVLPGNSHFTDFSKCEWVVESQLLSEYSISPRP